MNKKRNIPIIMILIYIVIITLSLIPSLRSEINIPNSDKITHAIAYMALSLSIILSCDRVRSIIILLFVSLIMGFIIECIQYYIPGRQFSLYDMLANTIGLVLGFIIGMIFEKQFLNILKKLRLIKFFK